MQIKNTPMLYTRMNLSPYSIYIMWPALAGGENAARLVHWSDQPGGQKTARHDSWEEEGRRSQEETACLHSTSLPSCWRTARSKQTLKLLNKLEPLTTASLIYYAYLLNTLFVSITGVKYRWPIPLEDDRLKFPKETFLPYTTPPPQAIEN